MLIDKGVLEKLGENVKVRSPGMKYKHYAPKADVTIIDGNLDEYRHYVMDHSDEDTLCMVFEKSDCQGINLPFICYGKSDEEQARELFDALRELDKIGAKKVFARCPNKNGVGLAVYNRLLRAAGFQVVKLR